MTKSKNKTITEDEKVWNSWYFCLWHRTIQIFSTSFHIFILFLFFSSRQIINLKNYGAKQKITKCKYTEKVHKQIGRMSCLTMWTKGLQKRGIVRYMTRKHERIHKTGNSHWCESEPFILVSWNLSYFLLMYPNTCITKWMHLIS